MDIPLGKQVAQPRNYDESLLASIPRAQGRAALNLDTGAMRGLDRWNAYEFCWLNHSGHRQTGVLELVVPASSPCIFESKSLKLYLNSCFYQTFDDAQAMQQQLGEALSRCAGANVAVIYEDLPNWQAQIWSGNGWQSLDHLAAGDSADLCLVHQPASVSESIYSHQFRSMCPVTGQPDWATILIQYRGVAIDHASLYSYLCSFSDHSGFHEQCVEQIYSDLLKMGLVEVSVCAKFLRRGGIDICPYRSNSDTFKEPLGRTPRQ